MRNLPPMVGVCKALRVTSEFRDYGLRWICSNSVLYSLQKHVSDKVPVVEKSKHQWVATVVNARGEN